MGDCVCCGKPADGIWAYQHVYTLEHWVKRHRVIKRETLKDTDGNVRKRCIEFTLPYCAKHLLQSQKLRNLRDSESFIGAVFMATSVLLYVAAVIFHDPFDMIAQFPPFAKFLMVPVLIFFSSLILSTLFFMIVNTILSRFRYFADHPLDSNAVGGSGLALDIVQANTREKWGNVRYDLRLGFMRKEAAEQFMDRYYCWA